LNERDYMQLVRRLEVDSTISPTAFRTRVILLSSSAYIALFGTLGASALLVYFGVKWARDHHSTQALIRIALFGVLMLPAFYAVLRMFFLRLTPPQGRFITREEAPALFGKLDIMRKKLRGPPIHRVLINDEYNAAISQLPRFGLFGGHTNYLMLGLPYLLGVTHKEMLATIAHEYGHLCGNHGKMGAWVYRQRRTFGALYDQVRDASEGNWVHGGMARALDCFMPYFSAYTFVLSRQNEYQADQTASELVGADVNANGLVRDALLGRWIHDEFWPKLHQQADTAMRPSFMPFSAMRTAFKASYHQWATPERLAAAWLEKSGLLDTHPALRDRVEATGAPPVLPACVEVTAAEALLGARFAKRLIEEFDQGWWAKERQNWEGRCKYVTRSRARLLELSAQPLAKTAPQHLYELALLKSEFETPQAAKAVLEHLLKRDGGPFPKAAFIYGRILLDEDNGRGLDHLAAAADKDRSLVEEVARIGYDYLLKTRDEVAARAWWKQIMPYQDDE